MPPIDIDTYHAFATRHRREHGCEGYPFEDGRRLRDIVRGRSAERVLELGTAVGFSAFCLASAGPAVHVDTIDRDPEHVRTAATRLAALGLGGRVRCHEGDFGDVIATLDGPYDLVFVDGFEADPALLPRLTALTGGAILAANLSWSSTTAAYVEDLRRLGWAVGREGDIALATRPLSMQKAG